MTPHQTDLNCPSCTGTHSDQISTYTEPTTRLGSRYLYHPGEGSSMLSPVKPAPLYSTTTSGAAPCCTIIE